MEWNEHAQFRIFAVDLPHSVAVGSVSVIRNSYCLHRVLEVQFTTGDKLQSFQERVGRSKLGRHSTAQ